MPQKGKAGNRYIFPFKLMSYMDWDVYFGTELNIRSDYLPKCKECQIGKI